MASIYDRIGNRPENLDGSVVHLPLYQFGGICMEVQALELNPAQALQALKDVVNSDGVTPLFSFDSNEESQLLYLFGRIADPADSLSMARVLMGFGLLEGHGAWRTKAQVLASLGIVE